MSLVPILLVPHPALREKTAPITLFDRRVKKLADDMLETMYEGQGIGLAGPQIGSLERILVMDVAGENEKPNPLLLVNPEIVWRSEEESSYNEGCLSIPGQYGEVVRPSEVKVKYQSPDGQEKELSASGLLSTCVQHEIDHLHGILFIDHLSKLKRDILMRKYRKAQAANEG